MGYTHHWRRPVEIGATTFATIAEDCRKLLPALQEAGVVLADGNGDGDPVIHPNGIWLNGSRKCGHKPDYAKTTFAGQLERLDEYLQLEGRTAWIWDWHERRCSGYCTFETFQFLRVDWSPRWPDKVLWDSCKTNRRHYDLAVTAFLIVAKHHLGDDLELCGYEELWQEARELCQRTLGYGLDLPLFSVEHSH